MKKILLFICLGLMSEQLIAQNYYHLKITNPNVVGTSVDPDHVGEIVLEDFNFSILNTVNIESTTVGGYTKRATSGPITLKFKLIKGATELFKSLHKGDAFEEFMISVQKQGVGGVPFDYITYTFKAVLVSNFTSSYVDSSNDVFYTIAAKVGTIKMNYRTLASENLDDNEMMWSFIKNNVTEAIN